MTRLRLKDYLVIAGGILLIGLSLSFAHVNPAGSAVDESVRVVNTPLPVTLQGTGTISGTVAATQSGTWNVGINGTPMFNLANLADIAKALGIGAPFESFLQCSFGESSGHNLPADGDVAACNVGITTPTHQRIVIETVTAGCGAVVGGATKLVDAGVFTSAGTFNGGGLVPNGLSLNDSLSLSQTVRFYGDPNTLVGVGLFADRGMLERAAELASPVS